MKLLSAFPIITILLAICGCSYLKSSTVRTISTNPTNGVQSVVEKTDARGWTLLDANASLVKFSNRSGYATNGMYAPGTYATGVNEASTSTNLSDVVSAVARGVVQGLK